MLKTPNNLRDTKDNPVLAMLAVIQSPGCEDKKLEEGFMVITHFSSDILVWGRNAPEMYMGYPNLEDTCDINSFGVCDSPAQFIERYKQKLADDPVRTFFCTFTHIPKDPSNRGRGGGWRWHKWGPYVGDGKPAYEYLDDEEGFADGVWVYHVLQIAGPDTGLAKWERDLKHFEAKFLNGAAPSDRGDQGGQKAATQSNTAT